MSSPPPLRTIGLGFVLRALNTARGFALGLVTVAVLVREMGSSGYGTVAIALAAASGVGIASSLGFEQAIIRGVAGTRACEDQVSRGALRAAMGTGAAGGGVLLVIAFIEGGPVGRALAAAALCSALLPVRTVLRSTLTARARVGLVEAGTGLHDTLFSLGALALVAAGRATPAAVVLMEVAGSLAAIALLLPGWLHETGPARRGPVVVGSLPFFAATITRVAVQHVPIWVLAWHRGPAAVGHFAPVLQLALYSQVVLGMLSAYYLTELVAATRRGDDATARELYATTAKWGLVLVTPIAFALVAAPRAVLPMLFGDAVAGMVNTSRLLGIGFALNAMTGFSGLSLMGLVPRSTVATRSLLAGALVVLAALVLVPLLGTAGAALATAAAVSCVGVVDATLVWRSSGLHPLRRDVLGVAATGAAAVAVGAVTVGSSVATSLAAGVVATVAVTIVAALTRSTAEGALFAAAVRRARRAAWR